MDDESSLRDAGCTKQAMNAVREMHYGRLEYLAYYIRHADYRIHPIVAKQILNLIENNCEEGDRPPHCRFQLQAVRAPGLPSASRDPELDAHRDLSMAIEVARKCGFKRGYISKTCHEVGQQYELDGGYVYRKVAKHKGRALEVVAEEKMQAAYERGELDFLGRPISE